METQKLTIRGGLPILIGVPDLSNPVFVLGDKTEPKARFILTKSKREIPATKLQIKRKLKWKLGQKALQVMIWAQEHLRFQEIVKN